MKPNANHRCSFIQCCFSWYSFCLSVVVAFMFHFRHLKTKSHSQFNWSNAESEHFRQGADTVFIEGLYNCHILILLSSYWLWKVTYIWLENVVEASFPGCFDSPLNILQTTCIFFFAKWGTFRHYSLIRNRSFSPYLSLLYFSFCDTERAALEAVVRGYSCI